MVELKTYLKRFRRRQRIQDGLSAFQIHFWVPCLLALLAQVAGRLFPIPNLWILTLAPLFAWLLFAWGRALFRPFPLLSAALRTDEAAELKERLSSAFAFKQRPLNPGQEPLVNRQYQDALVRAAEIDLRRTFTLSWQPRPVLIGLALLLSAGLSAALPNKMHSILRDREIIKETATMQAEMIAEAAEELDRSNDLSPEDREQLVRDLEKLAQKLRLNKGDLEEALADLSRFDERTRSDLDPSLDIQSAYLEQLANQLNQMTGTQPKADPLDTLQESLNQLEKDAQSLSDEEKEQLTRQIAQLSAQAAQSGAADLRQSLSALAHAIQSGDPQSLDQAFSSLQADLQSLDRQIGDQQAIQAALSTTQAARNAFADTGRQLAQNQSGSGSPASGSQMNQPGNQPGGQPGSQTGQSSGFPSGGGGSQSNTLPPASGGKTQLPSPQGQAAETVPGSLNRQIYAPWQRTASDSRELFIPGQDTQQGETSQSQGQGNLPGGLNPALMPYTQVFPQYLTAANQAFEQALIPVELRDYVRDYFSSLEP